MAYGLKYQLLCASKDGNLYKLNLLFDGYTGVEIDRNIPADSPLVLKKDKAAVIRGTSLDFIIREEIDFEMDEFYTNLPRKIKALLYRETTLIWAGYVLSQQYDARYVSAPLNISFCATDGLGLLKEEKFILTGLKSQLEILIHCIDKIGLGLGYSIAINLFHSEHDETRSPLAQTYEEADIYEDESCYDVITNILGKYDAEITQVNGSWQITRSVDKKSSRLLYSADGNYVGTEAAPGVLNLGYKGSGIDVWPVGELRRSMEPGGNRIKIIQLLGLNDSILSNYDFSLYETGLFNEEHIYHPWARFTSWLQYNVFGAFIPEQVFTNGGPYALLPGNSTSNNNPCDYLYQEKEILASPQQFFKFNINIGAICKTSGVSEYNILKAWMRIILTNGTVTYYLNEDGVWLTQNTFLKYDIESNGSGLPRFRLISILAPVVPIDGTLRIELYRFGNSSFTPSQYTALCYALVNVMFTADQVSLPGSIHANCEFSESTERNALPDFTIKAADAPTDIENAPLVYKNITRLADGTPT